MATMANAIGMKPFWKECMYSCLITANHAAMIRAATFMISETCRFITPRLIQRFAPLTVLPTPGSNTHTSRMSAPKNTQSA